MPSEPTGESPFTKPDHADFDLLKKVVQEYLAPREGEDPQEALRANLVLLCDPQSASYAGTQRAISFLQISDPQELQERFEEVFRLGVFWLDGFLAGGHLERSRHEPEAEPEEEEKI